MLKLIIEDDEGRKTIVPFVRDEITIGRQEGNTIRLTERNVSRQHARLLRKDGSILVEDLNSYNGVRVNGERVIGHAAVHDGDLIEIGDYDLELEGAGAGAAEHVGQDSPRDVTPPHGIQMHAESEGATVAFDHASLDAKPAPEAKPSPEAKPTPEPKPTTNGVAHHDEAASRKPVVRDLPAAEAPRLVALNTDLAGREFKVVRTEVRIGRTPDNDISLEHRSLSRTHAKLVREESGGWRIIDLRSANGLLVNGERYAEAPVSHLDTLELGHLKLRFVAAGQPFSLVPGVSEAPKSRRSKPPALLIAGAAVLLVGAAAAYFAFSGDTAQRPARPAESRPQTAASPSPTAEPEADAPSESERPAEGAAGSGDSAEPERQADSAPRKERTGDEARAELLLKKRLERAAKAIDDGKLDEAKALLEEAVATVAFQDQHKALTTRLAEARREREATPKREREKDRDASKKRATAKPTAPAPPEEEPPPPKPNPADEAKKLYDEGVALFTRKQNREAREVFKRCLAVDSSFARCHLMVGSASARLGEADVGARHYEMFLRLAPAAPEAPKVRAFLDDYHKSKQRDSN